MDTWRDKNPDFEYICWTEAELKKRGLLLECGFQIDKMEEWCGKADILRLELLYQFGGIYIDADSICIERLDNHIMGKKAFASYENEAVRQGLVANVTIGFPPKHPLCRAAIDFILNNPTDMKTTGKRAWMTTGPVLLTNLLQTGKYPDVHIFPSYTFIPIHYSGIEYKGHGKVYAYQEWGSSKQNYDTMNAIELPRTFLNPVKLVSVLATSYNTKIVYIRECLESIKAQEGYIGIELVWINDGSDGLNTTLLEKALDNFKETTRFCRVIYHKMDENRGLSYCLNRGVQLCSNSIIFRMDSDDIMIPTRIMRQLTFMEKNADCVLCGANIQFFRTNEKNEKMAGSSTQHPERLTLDEYKRIKSPWFINHPTFCFKREAVLEVGNYNDQKRIAYEDFELVLKLMKRFGVIYNVPENLLYYRLHPDQLTYNGRLNTPQIAKERNDLMEQIIFS